MTAGGTRGRALIVAGTLAAPATAGPDVVGDVLDAGGSDGTHRALAAGGCGGGDLLTLFTTTGPGGGAPYLGGGAGTVTAHEVET